MESDDPKRSIDLTLALEAAQTKSRIEILEPKLQEP
jgi:hypothetical protein